MIRRFRDRAFRARLLFSLGAMVLTGRPFAAIADGLEIIEQLPPSPAINYATGQLQLLPAETVWRPMCGSDTSQLDAATFAKMVASAKAPFAGQQGGTIIDTSGPRTGGVNLIFNVTSPPAGAVEALGAVEAYVEGQLTDPVNVTINISFAPLGAGILGSTSSTRYLIQYPDVRTGMVNGMDANDTIQLLLPNTATIPVRFDGAASTVTNTSDVLVHVALYNATIGITGDVAATIQISTNFSFDYDPSDGITGGTTCFQSVMIHEIAHALGFSSNAECTSTPGRLTVLDFFRFQNSDGTGTDFNPDTNAEFTTTARLVDCNVPNDDVNSDLISVEYRMSDGNPNQASHFQAGGGTPATSIGIMVPAISSGATYFPNFYRTSDATMLDAIGWSYPPPADTMAPAPTPTLSFGTTTTTAITMTSTASFDGTPPVQYLFDATAGSPGETDSALQNSRTYTDSGLTANTSYSYRVRAQDSVSTPNQTAFSSIASTVTLIETPTGVAIGTITTSTVGLTASGTLTSLNAGQSGVFFDSTTAGGDGGLNVWTQTPTTTANALLPNTTYAFQVKARNRNAVETAFTATTNAVTLANTPAAPTLAGAMATTMTLDVNTNGNPAATTFALQCTASVPNDATWTGKFVSAAGAPAAVEAWQTDATWAVKTITGLKPDTSYTFGVKARNSALVQTMLGPTATLSTTFLRGDCNQDRVFNAPTDTPCFVAVLLGTNTDPGSIQRSDMNGDTVADGADIQGFVNCAISGCP